MRVIREIKRSEWLIVKAALWAVIQIIDSQNAEKNVDKIIDLLEGQIRFLKGEGDGAKKNVRLRLL